MFKDFKITKVEDISGLLEINFDVFSDTRGMLYTTYLKEVFDKNFKNLEFIHDKFALNKAKGTLRGIHGDEKSWKFVTTLIGSTYQIVVDNRRDSSTYGNVYKSLMHGDEPMALLIPPGCGNGFQTLEDNTLYHYKLSYSGKYNDAPNQFTIPWNSKKFNINWPIKEPIISDRDKNAKD